MPCSIGTNVIVCGPPGVYMRRVIHCPACNRRHRFVVSWDGAWYGSTYYGLCGDAWQDGEMAPRPFERGWRREAQVRAAEMWKYAASPEGFRRYQVADRSLATAKNDRQVTKAIRKRAAAMELIRRERAS